MAEGLKVGGVVGAAFALGYDVIDIDGGGGDAGGKAVDTEGMVAEVHLADSAPAAVVSALGGSATGGIVGGLRGSGGATGGALAVADKARAAGCAPAGCSGFGGHLRRGGGGPGATVGSGGAVGGDGCGWWNRAEIFDIDPG